MNQTVNVDSLSLCNVLRPNTDATSPLSCSTQLRLITDMPLLNSQHAFHVLIAQPHTLFTSEQLSSLEHILDLPAIHLIARQFIEIVVIEAVLLTFRGGVEEVDPHVSTG